MKLGWTRARLNEFVKGKRGMRMRPLTWQKGWKVRFSSR
jgi:hypothetical protein